MKAITLIELMETGEYDSLTVSEFAKIYREQLEALVEIDEADELYEDSSQADADYEMYKEDRRGCND